MNKAIVIFFLSVFLVSCHKNEIPSEVRKIIEQTQNEALLKVLIHYGGAKDSLKFKAACFLIANMGNKGFYEGTLIHHYDQIFEIVENKVKLKGKSLSEKEIEEVLNSVVETEPVNSNKVYKKDIDTISYNYLVTVIDLTYSMWKRQPYARHISFEDYLLYVLPYRSAEEPLDNSRETLQKKYYWILDSLKDKTDPVEACKMLNNDLRSWFMYVFELRKYPAMISINNILKGRIGNCADMANLAAASMRSVGIPVAVDMTPLWANRSSGHTWNVVFDKKMKAVPFMGAESNPGEKSRFKETEKPSKIFRLSYKLQNVPIYDNPENIPNFFKREDCIDVTEDYVPVSDVCISILNNPQNKNYAYLCTFNNELWVPITWGNINEGKVEFKKMGRDVLYIPAFCENGNMNICGNPIILNKEGKIKEICMTKNEFQDMKLYRKYPVFPDIEKYIRRMINGKFQGSNNPDFSDAVDLYVIKDMPETHLQEIKINSGLNFRYIRYIGPEDGFSDIAEFEIYGTSNNTLPAKRLIGKIIGKGENNLIYHEAFDGNWDTYFYSKNPGRKEWVGMEFNEPVKITHIKFLPRNDNNSIRVGDTYELFYWDKGWKLKGRQTASGNSITFMHMPKNSLYWLRNRTRGREERIFTYSDGKQIWW
jgi:hypothetical protein